MAINALTFSPSGAYTTTTNEAESTALLFGPLDSLLWLSRYRLVLEDRYFRTPHVRHFLPHIWTRQRRRPFHNLRGSQDFVVDFALSIWYAQLIQYPPFLNQVLVVVPSSCAPTPGLDTRDYDKDDQGTRDFGMYMKSFNYAADDRCEGCSKGRARDWGQEPTFHDALTASSNTNTAFISPPPSRTDIERMLLVSVNDGRRLCTHFKSSGPHFRSQRTNLRDGIRRGFNLFLDNGKSVIFFLQYE
ncbi:hypothetical protein BDZ89DRAFT_1138731 [Hymenopellis radicata]|nr:hypothetical protein BDZ89DRAFT_1138731 [Hymenopellis radicata]